MITKVFELNGENVTVSELTLGQMRKIDKMIDGNELDATVEMVKMATKKDDDFLDSLGMSDIRMIGEWLGSPTE